MKRASLVVAIAIAGCASAESIRASDPKFSRAYEGEPDRISACFVQRGAPATDWLGLNAYELRRGDLYIPGELVEIGVYRKDLLGLTSRPEWTWTFRKIDAGATRVELRARGGLVFPDDPEPYYANVAGCAGPRRIDLE